MLIRFGRDWVKNEWWLFSKKFIFQINLKLTHETVSDRLKQMIICDHKGIICHIYQLLNFFQVCIFQGHMTTKYKFSLISDMVTLSMITTQNFKIFKKFKIFQTKFSFQNVQKSVLTVLRFDVDNFYVKDLLRDYMQPVSTYVRRGN